MSKARAKFWPSSCDVPICNALPSPIIASQVMVLIAPANRSCGGLAANDNRDGEHVGP